MLWICEKLEIGQKNAQAKSLKSFLAFFLNIEIGGQGESQELIWKIVWEKNFFEKGSFGLWKFSSLIQSWIIILKNIAPSTDQGILYGSETMKDNKEFAYQNWPKIIGTQFSELKNQDIIKIRYTIPGT